MRQKPNILFLSIEDLNDWIEPLGGHPDAVTPNLTRLARRCLLFENAYAEAPACSPSRTSVLFGRHPWSTGIYVNQHKWHDVFPPGRRLSLVGRFRDAGWETRGAGKIFHNFARHMDLEDWTDYRQDTIEEWHEPLSRSRAEHGLGLNTDWGPIDDGAELYDDRNTEWFVRQLQPGASGQFWALGIYRPHLPCIVPRRFFEMLPERLAPPPGLGANRFAPGEDRAWRQLPPAGRRMADLMKRHREALWATGEHESFVRAYLASIAYADWLLGRVLDRMDECGLWANTHVILWSDHGFQLGEKLALTKFTLWERALRVPLMFGAPDIEPGRCRQPVALPDIGPTLFRRLGLPVPAQFEGQDLSPAFRDAPLARDHAVAVWGSGFAVGEPRLSMTARSATHRYILYWDGGEELYDHRTDPWEHRNLIRDPGDTPREEIEALRERHQRMLPESFADPVSVGWALKRKGKGRARS